MTLLTVRQVAERLQVNPTSVYLLVEQRRLAHHRVGSRRGAIRISEEDLAAYLTGCRTQQTEKQGVLPARHLKLKHIKL